MAVNRVFFVIFSALIVSCFAKNEILSKTSLSQLKQNYPAEIINYVYNCVYFKGSNEIILKPHKWKDSIYVSVTGDLWDSDSVYIKRTLNQINDLKLGITLLWANQNSKPDISMYFGDYKYLRKKLKIKNKNFSGISVYNYDSIAAKIHCKIGINNRSLIYAQVPEKKEQMREHVILHEILHSLGFYNHNLDDNESALFYGHNYVTKLSNRDKEALRFWYSPLLPNNYSKNDFEKDFQDILHCKNTASKIVTHCIKNDIDIDVLKYIEKNCFKNGKIKKYPGTINLNYRGKVDELKLGVLFRTIDYLNKNAKNINFSLNPSDSVAAFPCFNLSLEKDTTIAKNRKIISQKNSLIGMESWELAYADIKLYYKNDTLLTDHFLNDLILTSVANTLGVNSNGKDSITTKNLQKDVVLKTKYLDVLNLIYNPVIPNGLNSLEFQYAIEKLADLKNNN